jgi:hypothetical protein
LLLAGSNTNSYLTPSNSVNIEVMSDNLGSHPTKADRKRGGL